MCTASDDLIRRMATCIIYLSYEEFIFQSTSSDGVTGRESFLFLEFPVIYHIVIVTALNLFEAGVEGIENMTSIKQYFGGVTILFYYTILYLLQRVSSDCFHCGCSSRDCLIDRHFGIV